jgi:hypothetical protein
MAWNLAGTIPPTGKLDGLIFEAVIRMEIHPSCARSARGCTSRLGIPLGMTMSCTILMEAAWARLTSTLEAQDRIQRISSCTTAYCTFKRRHQVLALNCSSTRVREAHHLPQTYKPVVQAAHRQISRYLKGSCTSEPKEHHPRAVSCGNLTEAQHLW